MDSRPRTPRRRPRAALAAGVLTAALAAGLLTAVPAQAVAGAPAPDGTYTFTARLDIGGERVCSGALVAPQWIATAASCFATNPEQSHIIPSGKPTQKTVATVGRTDLAATGGHVGEIVELVPRSDRDLVLARLAKPVSGVAPVPVAGSTPAPAEVLTVGGYGRTKDTWIPGRLHTSTFAAGTVDALTLPLAGTSANSAVCKGDTGGPALRTVGGKVELAAVSSRSWQGGCLGVDDPRNDAVATRVDNLKDWIETTTTAAPVTDFNCDGQRDVAIGDPGATVGGDAKAGLVRIVYGGGKGTAEINQDLAAVPGGAEPSDWYGETLATFDHDLDGCTDLAVGTPAEDLGTQADAGTVQVLYGARAGLTKGKAPLNLEQGNGGGAIGASGSEAGDRMGHALAAGATSIGDPYLLIGTPGEDLGTVADAGTAFYLRGSVNAAIHQDKPGVSGAPEKDDRFGSAVAGSPRHLAVGGPGEAVEAKAGAGGTEVLEHKISADGIPTPIAGLTQDLASINGDAEPGDQFGASLAMVPYRPAGAASATDSILAVGSPGEAHGTVKDAGRVVTLRIPATGPITQLNDIHQGSPDVTGNIEASDGFGRRVTAISIAPGAVNTPQNTLLAVGTPNEDIGAAADAGTITVFPLIGAPGASDVVIEPGHVGLPGAPGAAQRLGTNMTANGSHLYVGMPYGPAPFGAVHTVPWANIVDKATEPVTTYQPGKGGLPNAGDRFGTAIQ